MAASLTHKVLGYLACHSHSSAAPLHAPRRWGRSLEVANSDLSVDAIKDKDGGREIRVPVPTFIRHVKCMDGDIHKVSTRPVSYRVHLLTTHTAQLITTYPSSRHVRAFHPHLWPTSLTPISALYLYDFLLTFGDEVRYVWRRRFSGATLLFAVNRYASLLACVVNAFGLAKCHFVHDLEWWKDVPVDVSSGSFPPE